MLQGKSLVCYATFVLFHIDLFSSTEMRLCVVRNFEITKLNRVWLTQIFLCRFYKAYIPEIRLPLGSGVDCVEPNPAPVVTDVDVS